MDVFISKSLRQRFLDTPGALQEFVDRNAAILKEMPDRWYNITSEGDIVPVDPSRRTENGSYKVPTEMLQGVKIAALPFIKQDGSRICNFLLFSEINSDRTLRNGQHKSQ